MDINWVKGLPVDYSTGTACGAALSAIRGTPAAVGDSAENGLCNVKFRIFQPGLRLYKNLCLTNSERTVPDQTSWLQRG